LFCTELSHHRVLGINENQEICHHAITTEKQTLTHQRCDEINELKVHSSNQEAITMIWLNHESTCLLSSRDHVLRVHFLGKTTKRQKNISGVNLLMAIY